MEFLETNCIEIEGRIEFGVGWRVWGKRGTGDGKPIGRRNKLCWIQSGILIKYSELYNSK